MKKIILHIGRHKSGTSSIQRFLSESVSLLEENSILYPAVFRKGFAHHRLAGLLKRTEVRKLSADELTERVGSIRCQLHEILESQYEVFVFSSEAFQNCNPKVVHRVFSNLGCDIHVACYFRDQASYLASAYNQKVHANIYDIPLDEFVDRFGGYYMKFADNWAEFFSGFSAKVFNRNQLYKQNVIDDFFRNFLCLEIPELDVFQELKNRDQNISLSAEILSFKLELNKRVKRGQVSLENLKPEANNLYQALAKMSGIDNSGKFSLNAELFSKIKQKFEEHNASFSSKYLNDVPLEFSAPGKGLPIITESRFEEIYREIFDR